jgi:N-methylhydantoinase A
MRIGIDAGGTFTDFIVLDDEGEIRSFKLRSNPADPAAVILAGLERIAPPRGAEIIHGSTVATNALLERKGAKTAFVTTRGFEDILTIGRQNRAELYNLMPAPRRLLVERRLSLGVDERTYFDGTIGKRPEPRELESLRERLRRAGVRSVAVCLLHSYQNAENELAVEKALGGLQYLSRSSEICPEFREFERASTTALNAYVGPLMDAYLGAIERRLRNPVSVMQSNGGLMKAAEARRHAVRTILSGPAGGVVGAIEAARRSGFVRALGFDMGGTSTDVSLSEGRPRETVEASVDGFPIRVPMLDIHTVGAGGGSIARVDRGGLLRVGPESAGAKPGPACYGAGEDATVTDAHVVLGRIAADQLVGGAMHLDASRARRAVARIAGQLRLSVDEAAAGILRVANANMQRAIRAVSVERGYDARDFALVAFGGCGGLHACELAAELGIRIVIVPQFAEGLSALGMLLADRVRDYAAGVLNRADFERRFRTLERQARKDMPGARLERLADYRYPGQSYEITLLWGSDFHAAHEKMYGYADRGRGVQTVAVRVRAILQVQKPKAMPVARVRGAASTRQVFSAGRWRMSRLYRRETIPPAGVPGPALVLDYGSTTLAPAGWFMRLDRAGNLILTVKGRR